MTILFVSFPTMNSTSGLSSSLSMIRTANNSKSSFHEKMQIDYKWISNFFSITCHYTRNLRLFAMAVLCLTCCGCITGTVAEFCDNCYEKTRIIERTGEFSQDGTTFIVYSKKQIEYRRNPFRKQPKTSEQETTYVYSMTEPERNGKLHIWTIVPTDNAKRLYAIYFSVAESGPSEKVDYNKLILPVFQPQSNHYRPSKTDFPSRECIIPMHPDDIPYLKKPFIIDFRGKHILAIPYMFENNVCHLYLPQEDIVTPKRFCFKQRTASNILWKTVLLPIPIVTDIVLLPIEISLVVYKGGFPPKHPLGP